MDNIAIVTDIRGGDMFGELSEAIGELEELGFECEILFLEASNETLIKRYKETRRLHPSAGGGRIIDGINKERVLLSDAKSKAAHIIDTSRLVGSPAESSDKIYVQFKRGFGTDY